MLRGFCDFAQKGSKISSSSGHLHVLPDHVITSLHHTALLLHLYRETGCTNVVVPLSFRQGWLRVCVAVYIYSPFYYACPAQFTRKYEFLTARLLQCVSLTQAVKLDCKTTLIDAPGLCRI